MNKRTGEDRILTVPNVITATRLIGTPVLFYFILKHSWTAAFVTFFVVAITDKLDGLAANVLKQHSRLGRMLDPAVDYFMLGFITIGVMVTGPWWFRGLVLVQLMRMIYVARLAARRRIGHMDDLAVSRDGKIAMVAGCFNIAAFMLYHGGSDRLFLGMGIAFFAVWSYFGATSLLGYLRAARA